MPSVEISKKGRRGCVEGMKGYVEVPPGPAIEAMPGNGGPLNLAGNRPVSAPKVFDTLTERAAGLFTKMDVPTLEGEVWERSPETIEMDGTSVRAIFHHSPHGEPLVLSGATGLPLNHNADLPMHSGVAPVHHTARDTCEEEVGGAGTGPLRAGGAGEHFRSRCRSAQAEKTAVSGQFCRGGITSSDGTQGCSGALEIANMEFYNMQEAGGVEESGRSIPGGPNMGQILTDRVQSAPAFANVRDATVFATGKNFPREKGVLLEGQVGFNAWGARRAEPSRSLNDTYGKEANQIPAYANLSAQNQRSSAWGRVPEPSRTGNWSPDYREAFPSLRRGHGNDEVEDFEQPRMLNSNYETFRLYEMDLFMRGIRGMGAREVARKAQGVADMKCYENNNDTCCIFVAEKTI